MDNLSTETILNGTPYKKILNGYRNLKGNYTEESSNDYYEIYSNQPLSAIFESSEMIFSEPYKGTNFFEHLLTDYPCFTKIDDEVNKIESYFEKYNDKMSDEQKEFFESHLNEIKEYCKDSYNTRIISSYIKNNIDDSFESTLLEAYHENNTETLNSIFEDANPTVFLTYAPFVADKMNGSKLTKLVKEFSESINVEDELDIYKWRPFIEAVTCCNKLVKDKVFTEAMKNSSNVYLHSLIDVVSKYNVKDVIEEYVVSPISSSYINIYENGDLAVNKLFDDIIEASMNEEDDTTISNLNNLIVGTAYKVASDILTEESVFFDETVNEKLTGYTLLKKDITMEEADKLILKTYADKYDMYVESLDPEDLEDDDDDDEDDDDERGDSKSKKVNAPKPSLANKIQNKAMDAEAQQKKQMSGLKKKGQEIGNAVKAVVRVPMNVVNSIKEIASSIEEADSERRRNYMKRPGFRKKVFRNLKIAIVYGAAAYIKLALVPVVAVCHYFSSQKDKRTRMELVHLLETEIKVTDEKIQDANSRGDNNQKYQLMRIKDKLEIELARVAFNGS